MSEQSAQAGCEGYVAREDAGGLEVMIPKK